MTACLVFFNGPSLYTYLSMPKRLTEIGCNYIESIRPTVDHVVCYDPEMRTQITQSPVKTYWCKNGHRSDTWRELCYPMIDAPQCSGTLALRLAIQLKFDTIRILGCDWGHTEASVFQHRYDKFSPHKYSASKVRQMDRWMKDRDIRVVSNHSLAFSTAPISTEDFYSWYNDWV